MTIVLSIAACINFLVIVLGVPYVLWTEKPKGSGGLGVAWWAIVTLLVLVFGVVSLVAELALATSTSTIGRLALVLVVLFIVFMFFTRKEPIRA